MTGLSKGGTFVEFGEFGMQSLDRCWITAQQIEACRVTISRTFSRKGQVWIRIFPDKPVSKKPAETRWVQEKELRTIRWPLCGPEGFCSKSAG